MLQPAEVAVEEGPKVVHSIFEHRQAIDSAAEGKALPFVGIEPAIGDHARVNHPGAEDLHPAFLPTHDTAALLHRKANIDFGRRLGEREIRWAHTEHDIVALEECLEESLERPFQMTERDA